MTRKKTSIYQSVYYLSGRNVWRVSIKGHIQLPSFHDEYDAGIYAEYQYRELYKKSPNFPELTEAELAVEYKKVVSKREAEKAASLAKQASICRGVVYSSQDNVWCVRITRHSKYPSFHDEYDAGIYAEYQYREIHQKSPNFPELSDAELAIEYRRIVNKRAAEKAKIRAARASLYKGVCYENGKWSVRIRRYNSRPGFISERDAGIYAEYHYRNLYQESPNFPELSDAELAVEYKKIESKSDVERVGYAGSKSSKFKGVFYNQYLGRWGVRIKGDSFSPSFIVERDAGIYAEYQFRIKYNKSPNFPMLSMEELFTQYNDAVSRRSVQDLETRSNTRQGKPRDYSKPKTSKYVGVSKSYGSYRASITYQKKKYNLGSFSERQPDAEIKAALAYDKKALEFYGPNARLNFQEVPKSST